MENFIFYAASFDPYFTVYYSALIGKYEYDSVHIREKTDCRELTFRHILRSY